MRLSGIYSTVAKFVVGGGSGVVVGYVVTVVLSPVFVPVYVGSVCGYGVGGVVNFLVQRRLGNFRE